jgi:hypothetical protein
MLAFDARETFLERVNGLLLLRINEFEIEGFVNRAEIGGVARNQIGSDSPRSQCNQNIEMKLSSCEYDILLPRPVDLRYGQTRSILVRGAR